MARQCKGASVEARVRGEERGGRGERGEAGALSRVL
jgi:hypothetical protein